MSSAVIVKVYSSAVPPELLAMVPVYTGNVTPEDRDLVEFAKSQLQTRMSYSEIDSCRFKIERPHDARPPEPEPEPEPAPHRERLASPCSVAGLSSAVGATNL